MFFGFMFVFRGWGHFVCGKGVSVTVLFFLSCFRHFVCGGVYLVCFFSKSKKRLSLASSGHDESLASEAGLLAGLAGEMGTLGGF